MSGHSKWSTIKRQKGSKDQKRAVVFTKLSNAISVAVQQGGSPDPSMNFRLRLAVDAAKAANMPKDNIERAIQRSSGKGEAALQEQVYEGFGPGGFSVIVEAITDNTNRTSSEIRNLFEKGGGRFAGSGAVAYQFESKGEIVSDKSMSIDDLFLLAAEIGADDVKESEDNHLVYTPVEKLSSIHEALKEKGVNVIESSIVRVPTVFFDLPEGEEAREKALSFLEKIEENADVSGVYTNLS